AHRRTLALVAGLRQARHRTRNQNCGVSHVKRSQQGCRSTAYAKPSANHGHHCNAEKAAMAS
ncbi:MAG: hypothetical protein ACLQF2_10765, partial [Rhodomicrobium sp.]